MKTMYAAVFLIQCGIIIYPTFVRADEEAIPVSYTKTTADGKYIFVMHAPINILGGVEAGKAAALKMKYPKSGLYKNDHSNIPLWTVDWYSFEVYISANGKDLIRMGPWPRSWEKKLSAEEGALKQPAVAFYENGKLLKGYSIKDLIRSPDMLPRSVSHFRWAKDVLFDDRKDELKIITHDGQELLFDIKSGNITQKKQQKAGTY
jgi:hypothetical protein